MRSVIQWIILPAAVTGVPLSAHAVTYLSVEQAQKLLFPGIALEKLSLEISPTQRIAIEKASGLKIRNAKPSVWKAADQGWLLIDDVVGKHEFITFALALNADGSVKQIEVMDYRENYGSEVRNEKWRGQFVGKRLTDPVTLNRDIKNVTGATLSCRHLTEGVRRLLATYEVLLKS